MNRLILFLVLLGTAFAQSGPSSPAPPSSSTSAIPVDQQNSAKAQALIQSAILALGGQAYLEVQDVSQEGRTYSFHLGTPNSTGVLFWRFYKFPDQERVELTKQRDVADVYQGEDGAEITYKGVTSLETKLLNDYIRRREYSLDWVLRKWIHEPGVAFFYEGTSVAAQKPADQVSIINAKNQGVTLYLDINTHLPIKKTFTWRDPADRQRNIEDEVWDNYRTVQGILTPFSITRYYNGDMANQRFLNTVKYNTGLKDSLFAISGPVATKK
ncbi:MAG: hypothetical protein ABSE92_00835 [Terriglobales bacterium]|jgi:hypothetical protein